MSEGTPLWRGREDESCVVAVALHGGHFLRPEVARLSAVEESVRRRGEDPFTDGWTSIAPTRLVACRSRFEFDLNRSRAAAVYLEPDDAWGLEVWRDRPSPEVVDRSLANYDAVYDVLGGILDRAARRYGRFVVLDLHSYNHRRSGPDAPPEDPAANPDVNLGTEALDRNRWAAVVDGFLADLRAFPFPGRALDIGENIRFGGGHLSRWVAQRYPGVGCVLAVEVKKFFMDEHTDVLDHDRHAAVGALLASTVPGVETRLEVR